MQRLYKSLPLFIALGACASEFAELDSPEDYYLVENDCDPGGTWTLRVDDGEEECARVGTSLQVTKVGDELHVVFEGRSDFEKVRLYPANCGLEIIDQRTIAETETHYEQRQLTDFYAKFSGNELEADYTWQNSLYESGSLINSCRQDVELKGTR